MRGLFIWCYHARMGKVLEFKPREKPVVEELTGEDDPYQFQPPLTWECQCTNILFYVTEEECICYWCGLSQRFPDTNK